jgi:hypothetical protein
MRNRPLTLAYGGYAHARNVPSCRSSGQWGKAQREQLQHIHTPQSIDQELAHPTKDLEPTPQQQQRVRPLLDEHHDRIQALLDKNPSASRKQLAPQIHALSNETHRKIHSLRTDHQKELEKAMQQREHGGKKTGDLLRLS